MSPPVNASQTSPIQAALLALLSADSTLTALLTATGEQFYSGAVPQPDDETIARPLPIIVFVSPTEVTRLRFMRAGNHGTQQIDVWTANPFDQAPALAIFSRMKELVDQQPLTISGGTLESGELSLLSCTPAGGAMHLVALYRSEASH
jgi:hypothetical protein